MIKLIRVQRVSGATRSWSSVASDVDRRQINIVDLDLLQFGCGMCHMFYRFSFLFVCWRDRPDWSDVPGVILFFLSAVFLYLLPF